MAKPSFFDTTFTMHIQKESVKHFQQQLAAKKNQLIAAQEHYQNSVNLYNQIKQNLADKSLQVAELQRKTELSLEPTEKLRLAKQAEDIQQTINKYSPKLAPYEIKINQLDEEIKRLTTEVDELSQWNSSAVSEALPKA